MGRASATAHQTVGESAFNLSFMVDGIVTKSPVNLWITGGPRNIELTALVQPTDEALQHEFKDCDFRLVEFSSDSRRSSAYPMSQKDDGFVATRVISLDEELGSLIFHVVAVRRTGSVTGPVGSAAGVIVGETEPFYVHADELPEQSGNFIRVVWRDFLKHYPEISGNSHRLVFDDNVPYLALNSQLTSWRVVMESRARHGERARMRELDYAVIYTDVWQVLINRTIRKLTEILAERSAHDLPLHTPNPVRELIWWETKLLQMWFTRIYRMGPEDDWSRRLVNDIDANSPLEEAVANAVQRYAKLGDEFEALVGAVGAEDGGAT
jgi:hypothetical protein